MPGRNYIGPSGYRYGFGTQEKDDEIYGAGNSYSAEYWEYDPRLGRRWNIDRISYPWQGSYVSFNNNPIYFNDPLGLEGNPSVSGPDDDCKKGDQRSDGTIVGGTLSPIVISPLKAFKGFSYDEFNAGVEKTQKFAWSIDQKQSSTCGMAVCAMAFAKHDPDGYGKFARDLYFDGEAEYGNYVCTPDDNVFDTDHNNFKNSGMSQSDWVVLGSMKDNTNWLIDYGDDWDNVPWVEQASGGTYPGEVASILKDMGFNILKSDMNPVISNHNVNALNDFDKANNEGKTVIMLVNSSSMIYGEGPSSMSNHFIIYGGGLVIDRAAGMVSFKVWTWGNNPSKQEGTWTMSISDFEANFYGSLIISK